MSDIIFRSTDYPNQSNVAQPFKNISITELNQVSKLFMAPFFKLSGPNSVIITENTSDEIYTESGEEIVPEKRNTVTAPKLPAFVTPGGYHGSESFTYSYSGTELTINPGYCLIDELLVQFKKAYVIDLNKNQNFIDSSIILPLSGDISEITTNYTGKVYCVAYYSCYTNTGISGASGISGISGISGVRNIFKDNYSAYIGIITQPDTYLNNYTQFCFLYYITVTVVRSKVTAILSVGLTDPNNTLMTRKLPDYLYT